MKKYFEIDFLKFILMLGMVFRHAPLLVYDGMLSEYSIKSLNFYSFFIPVTSGFIFILGFTLACSFISNPNKINTKSYLNMFLFLLFSALTLGFISFLIKKPDTLNFLYFYFFYQWNQTLKPSFYILFPISFLYLINFFAYKAQVKFNIFLLLGAMLLFSILFQKYYICHYLIFGLLGYILGMITSFEKIMKISKAYWLLFFLLYLSLFFFEYKDNINLTLEMIMLWLFLMFLIHLGSLVERHKVTTQFITSASKNIFMFYILHVVVLRVIKTFFSISSFWILFIFSVLYFIASLATVFGINHIQTKIKYLISIRAK